MVFLLYLESLCDEQYLGVRTFADEVVSIFDLQGSVFLCNLICLFYAKDQSNYGLKTMEQWGLEDLDQMAPLLASLYSYSSF